MDSIVKFIEDPVSCTPLIVPEGRHHRQENTSAKKDTVEEKTEKSRLKHPSRQNQSVPEK